MAYPQTEEADADTITSSKSRTITPISGNGAVGGVVGPNTAAKSGEELFSRSKGGGIRITAAVSASGTHKADSHLKRSGRRALRTTLPPPHSLLDTSPSSVGRILREEERADLILPEGSKSCSGREGDDDGASSQSGSRRQWLPSTSVRTFRLAPSYEYEDRAARRGR